MASSKEDSENDDWEEINMLLELPNGADLDVNRKEQYLQVAGMWSDQPIVKLNNMLYMGKICQPLGSHLFVESKNGNGTKQMESIEDDQRQILVTDTFMKLEPIYLERKTGVPPDQPSDQGAAKEASNN